MRLDAFPSLTERWDALGRPFAHLPRWAAALALALLAAAMGWSALATAPGDQPERASVAAMPSICPNPQGRAKGDMALYARIAARVTAGEGYYSAALDEQRAGHYPTRPFVAVRLPTLAMLQAVIGVDGVRYAQMALVLACLWALNRREAPLAAWPERVGASVLLALGGGAALNPVAGLDHDFSAGLCLTLALLLYRRNRWLPALLAAALALAVRELAAPFVLLWLAFALAEQRWREAGAVAVLLALFAGGMALHFAAVEAGRVPGDLASQGWSALAGYRLPLTALAHLTGLRLLPVSLAAPLAILPLVGWAAIGGRIGLFALLWFAGLFTMMALFARPENFYWVQLALPAYGVGLAFAPRGLFDLFQSAAGRASRQT
ncbi:hypothetical protein FHS52_001155 [Erythromicrobium ramosum]|uniref:DUF2029 domain-containing protein n=1 Tax=Erythrobacter ramosus TaxID=35811 RepID=A0A6I4UH28_9SPHN|nr:hypothetical protein [Erythrobacter ramosus]MBB3775212.1 hypothetical protein [Erythrobacter ramosus]MXP37164.1 hypothetical protein [Erythrobacter ramosus]